VPFCEPLSVEIAIEKRAAQAAFTAFTPHFLPYFALKKGFANPQMDGAAPALVHFSA
jgi:hypothetical protein